MKTYKKNNITIKELDDGTIEHYGENNNLIYEKDTNGDEWHYKYDENNNLIYEKDTNGDEWHYKYDENNNLSYQKWPDGDERFYINNERVTKEEWINHYINKNFDHRYIFDILETLKDNNQKINIKNIKKHLNGIEIPNLKTKYEKVLKYCEILKCIV